MPNQATSVPARHVEGTAEALSALSTYCDNQPQPGSIFEMAKAGLAPTSPSLAGSLANAAVGFAAGPLAPRFHFSETQGEVA